MYLVAFVLYVVASCAIAWFLAKALTRRAQEEWPRWVVAGVLAPVVFYLPLADEIVGNYQFERLCEAAKEVKYYGTIPVGEDLYTPDGKWRWDLTGEGLDPHVKEDVLLRREKDLRLEKVIESYLRQERHRPPDIHAGITISGSEAKVYDTKTGRLLAEWRSYGTSGGWMSRNLEVPIIVRPQCLPERFRQVEQTLLRFSKSSEVAK